MQTHNCDVDDGEEVIPDGHSIRVPMMLMDAGQRDVWSFFPRGRSGLFRLKQWTDF
jgi:hypothetical protein